MCRVGDMEDIKEMVNMTVKAKYKKSDVKDLDGKTYYGTVIVVKQFILPCLSNYTQKELFDFITAVAIDAYGCDKQLIGIEIIEEEEI